MIRDSSRAEEFCLVCQEESEVGETMVLVCKVYDYEFWVHEEVCLRKYTNKLLLDPSRHDEGEILGTCYFCGRPVRRQHAYYVGRSDFSGKGLSGKGQNRLKYSFTEFPEKQPIFTHATCSEDSLMDGIVSKLRR